MLLMDAWAALMVKMVVNSGTKGKRGFHTGTGSNFGVLDSRYVALAIMLMVPEEVFHSHQLQGELLFGCCLPRKKDKMKV